MCIRDRFKYVKATSVPHLLRRSTIPEPNPPEPPNTIAAPSENLYFVIPNSSIIYQSILNKSLKDLFSINLYNNNYKKNFYKNFQYCKKYYACYSVFGFNEAFK